MTRLSPLFTPNTPVVHKNQIPQAHGAHHSTPSPPSPSKKWTPIQDKQGFQEKKCLLEKLEDETWRKIAEGDKADQELIELVGGQLPSRGDTKPQYWGLTNPVDGARPAHHQ